MKRAVLLLLFASMALTSQISLIFYELPEYTGKRYVHTSVEPHVCYNLPDAFRNVTSSLDVRTTLHVVVVLMDGLGCSGLSYVTRMMVHDLRPVDFDNRIQSYRVTTYGSQ